jgi:predicted transposase/invertase (TIGR01784 family)
MAKLQYKLTNDMLFKMVFVEYPELLQRLVAKMLNIPFESIKEFTITNTEMPPEEFKGKLCRLDINMKVNGKLVDLEVQVDDEHDYPERSLYHWARDFSSALTEGDNYRNLPETIVISILAFPMFDCEEYYSEFRPLEVTRGERLTDKQCMIYFELPKIPSKFDEGDELKWWLSLFKAETEEEMAEIKTKGGPIMAQAVEAYRHVSSTEKFKQLERMRSDAHHIAQASIAYAEQRGEQKAKFEAARNLLTNGVNADIIAKSLDLTVEEVLRL